MYFRKKTTGGRAYLQIVESRRDGARVRQQVIATLGRYDELSESGQLARLLRSGLCRQCDPHRCPARERNDDRTRAPDRSGPCL